MHRLLVSSRIITPPDVKDARRRSCYLLSFREHSSWEEKVIFEPGTVSLTSSGGECSNGSWRSPELPLLEIERAERDFQVADSPK
jgi:hypothetical protein